MTAVRKADRTAADRVLNAAVRDTIVVLRFAREVGRRIPTDVLALKLQKAAVEAEPLLPETLPRLGAVWESRWVTREASDLLLGRSA